VKNVLVESEGSNIPLLFLSGRHGILGANDLIPWYDQALTVETIDDLTPIVVAQLSDRD
jgi:hypothetical protein